MLSDVCFEVIEELLDAITRYDYSDEYIEGLIKAMMLLNEIRDDLDCCGKSKNSKIELEKIIREKVAEAKLKR